MAEAIRRLQVRGAPAIGVAAAYGLALGAREAVETDDPHARLNEIAAQLRATRPTAVNLGLGARPAADASPQRRLAR